MANPSDNIVAFKVKVRGLVQGVGFRPFVYRLAVYYKLTGWVANQTDGVEIKVEGPASSMSLFMEDLRHKAPVVAEIEEISVDQEVPEGLQGFQILSSHDLTDETSEISPDIAVCNDCISDMKTQAHRINYPFINCTNCGPRFSIIRDFPYDRKRTTMDVFVMCPVCRKEYEDIHDRRFHAQPVACNQCGPKYHLHCNGRIYDDLSQIMNELSILISGGKIIAVKGTGGFHLLCNALDEEAVSRLRQSKQREGKPFAVLFRDIEAIRKYAHVSATEEQSLLSWQRPVVILKTKKKLADSVSKGLNTVGSFLPYMPFHHLLFEKIKASALVLTSGNISDEPILINDTLALSLLGSISDAVLTYDREIYNRTDDSVLQVIAEKPRLIRRSRGFAPSPVKISFPVDAIFAAGAELVNCFCIGKGKRAYMSQHIGDLKNSETFAFYTETVERYSNMFRIRPGIAAADMHPDYLSTRYAHQLGLDVIQVQHHHAHIASCMAENGLDGPVIGLAFDGTGYGTDHNIWGGEFLLCDYKDFKRYSHFEYMTMPGGDKAAEEPWRMGISLLYQAYGREFTELDLPLLREVNQEKVLRIAEAIEKKINCPLTSGMGRLFDAVAAITGICIHSLHHAEAPMRLESALERNCEDHYEAEHSKTVSFLPVIRQICDDISKGISKAVISAKFHNTVVEAAIKVVRKMHSETGINKVVLSGGTFQNSYLSERMERTLQENHFQVFTHGRIPCNDGGIALGQLVIAAKKLNS